MKYTVNDIVHGFVVTRVRHVEELSGDLYELTHQKTGALVAWLDNGNENKLFSVTFKTLPENDTGVFHILEHSVLNGSKRYPVREPFVELLKSSMNTFLNAMTFNDKTMYPVSSKNEKDFMNLAMVYLDAVFCPKITENPDIFYQEGHHTELLSVDSTSVYKGVVFNEMKGATSSLDSIISDRLQRELFPDNCYKWNSGGDPRYIPDLTYEKYLETYRRFYHPSNARFYLDGSVPFEALLERIDADYLADAERDETVFEILPQVPVASHEIVNEYEISTDEEADERAQFSFGKIACRWDEPVKVSALNIVFEYLTGSNDAPLKRALLDSGLCEDVSMFLADGIFQPWFCLQVQNMRDEDHEEVLRLIRSTARKILSEGLHKKSIEAAINRMEFSVREPKEPLGIMHAVNAFSSWLYGGDPLLYLTYENTFVALREMLSNGGYEKLIEEVLLSEEGVVYLRTLPSYDHGEKLRAEETERLAKELSAMSLSEKEALVTMNEKLIEWQKTPDSPEALATLPQLDLSEVSPEPQLTPTSIYQSGSLPVIYHEQPCPGIAHITMMFRLTDYTLEELSYAALAAGMYGELPTPAHTVEELQTEIKLKTGRLNIAVDIFSVKNRPELCTPVLSVTCSVLESEIEHARELILELLTQSDFTQEDKIREMVLQEDYYSKTSIEGSGHSVAIGRASAHILATAAVNDAIAGIDGYRQLHSFAENFEEYFPDFARVCTKLSSSLCRERMILSVTAAHEVDLSSFAEAFEPGTPVAEHAAYLLDAPQKECFTIPSQISFAGFAFSPAQFGVPYEGSGTVAAQILSLDYLWNTVRVQGGAYGSGTAIRANDTMICYSYRDPSPVRSVNAFHAMPEYLREFCSSGQNVEKYIISTVSDTEPLRTPYVKGRIATAEYLSGTTVEDKIRYRRQMLSTSHEDLLNWADVIERASRSGAVCVIGFSEAVTDDSYHKEVL